MRFIYFIASLIEFKRVKYFDAKYIFVFLKYLFSIKKNPLNLLKGLSKDWGSPFSLKVEKPKSVEKSFCVLEL